MALEVTGIHDIVEEPYEDSFEIRSQLSNFCNGITAAAMESLREGQEHYKRELESNLALVASLQGKVQNFQKMFKDAKVDAYFDPSSMRRNVSLSISEEVLHQIENADMFFEMVAKQLIGALREECTTPRRSYAPIPTETAEDPITSPHNW